MKVKVSEQEHSDHNRIVKRIEIPSIDIPPIEIPEIDMPDIPMFEGGRRLPAGMIFLASEDEAYFSWITELLMVS